MPPPDRVGYLGVAIMAYRFASSLCRKTSSQTLAANADRNDLQHTPDGDVPQGSGERRGTFSS